MILEIPLQPVPNQRLGVRIEGKAYSISIALRRGGLYITVSADGETLVRNRALLSFAPLEGDLMLVDTRGTSDPVWDELGERYRLMYWTTE